MPILRLNAGDDSVALHQSSADPWASLRDQARGDGPVIVMVHGFKYRPGLRAHCPHAWLFGPVPCPARGLRPLADWDVRIDPDTGPGLTGPGRRQFPAPLAQRSKPARTWPDALGFGQGRRDEGLALAFGWNARGSIWRAYGRAAQAGWHLARVIRLLRRVAPDRPVHAVAHSLGARVVLQALPHLAPGDLHRVIALNPAEYHAAASRMHATQAGRATEVLTVWGRENLAYDLALQASVRPATPRDRVLGLRPLSGNGTHRLRLDCPETAAHLHRLGFDIAAPRRAACHRQPYLRPGLWPLYSALLRQPEMLPLAALGPPAQTALPEDPQTGALAEGT